MALPRIAVILWFLTTSNMGGADTEIKSITGIVGKDVHLLCNCSKTTEQVVWQVTSGTEIVVNAYDAKKKTFGQEHASYKNKSHLSPPRETGHCNLHLLQVSVSDQNVYTCYTFGQNGEMDWIQVNLTVRTQDNQTVIPMDKFSGAGTSFGVPLSVIAVVIVGIFLTPAVIVLLIRRHRRNIQEVGKVVDLQAGLPVIKHSQV